jgi:hypothetical protein
MGDIRPQNIRMHAARCARRGDVEFCAHPETGPCGAKGRSRSLVPS